MFHNMTVFDRRSFGGASVDSKIYNVEIDSCWLRFVIDNEVARLSLQFIGGMHAPNGEDGQQMFVIDGIDEDGARLLILRLWAEMESAPVDHAMMIKAGFERC